jgi:PAS domain S-box-containing protein
MDENNDGAMPGSGIPAQLAVTKGDIRKGPRTARMVLESEEWLFTTLRSIGDAVIVTDAEGVVVFMNPVAETLTGWPEREAIGMDCYEVFHIVNEATRVRTESPVDKVLRDGVISGLANHTLLIARDGVERSIDDSGSPVRNSEGELTGVVLIFRDVTDKRATERTIREQRDILQMVFDHIPVLVAFMDGDGQFRWINRAMERTLGWPLRELQAREASPEFQAGLVRRRSTGKYHDWIIPGWHDFRTTTRSGAEVHLSWTSVVLSDGTIIGIGQRMEEGTALPAVSAEKARLLEQMNERLRASFVETHHRVKNNLQTLSALVDLQKVASDGCVEEADLDKLTLHIRSLAAIHDLLARQSHAGITVDTLSARATLELLIPLLRETAGADRIGADLQDVALPMRTGMALAILVNELVTNAIKHGGHAVDISLRESSGTVTLEVCDNGAGFPPGFDPEKSASIGLELIEQMSHWDLRGETRYINLEDGRGGCVQVVFPRVLPAAAVTGSLPILPAA